MTTYDEKTFPKPDCPYGYSWDRIARALDDESFNDFSQWMDGQTMTVCSGQKYSFETKAYEADECAAHPHGGVVHSYDLHRFVGFLGPAHRQLWD